MLAQATNDSFSGGWLTLALLLVWTGGLATGVMLAKPEARDFYRLFRRAEEQAAAEATEAADPPSHRETDAQRSDVDPRGAPHRTPRGRLERLAQLPSDAFYPYAAVAVVGLALLAAIPVGIAIPGRASIGALIGAAFAALNLAALRIALRPRA